MTQAASELGYANATTLHKVRRGLALPDPARLAVFAEEQTILRHRTMNLHWIWTGKGSRLIATDRGPARGPMALDADADIINVVRQLEPEAQRAFLTLFGNRT
jgi:hypothetical protein